MKMLTPYNILGALCYVYMYLTPHTLSFVLQQLVDKQGNHTFLILIELTIWTVWRLLMGSLW
jgi:hypothetical protein